MSGFRDLSLRPAYYPQDRPLDSFYVPVLSAAVAYDRVAGYFRSTALAAAASGLGRFIAGGGQMRMIVGAELTEEDVRAATEGENLAERVARRLEDSPLEAADAIAEQRLAVLAWLVREGRLEIKVGVPTDKYGMPLPPEAANAYFHAKLGLLTDSTGDRIAFSGSVNESAAAWRQNLEQLHVYRSWHEAVWDPYGEDIARRFGRYWKGDVDAGWAIIDLPEAARQDLIAHAPRGGETPPRRDPAEGGEEAAAVERELLRFAAAAPRLHGGTGVGYATSGIDPFPHQLAIARRAVETFPRGYLLADEVGLGKTIEAGLIIRELLVSGRAERFLILVPASVLKQWQQELLEKLGLDVPRYEAGGFRDAQDHEVAAPAGTAPWNAFPIVLASSHLARRRARRAEVLAAGPWDIVLVDEAHHARRRGITDEPNALLRLLRDMRAARSWNALYLASATPMQMHAHEAWDLLDLLGLTGRWAESAEVFEAYYAELRNGFEERDWSLISRLAQDYAADGAARTDEALRAAAEEDLGIAGSRAIVRVGQEGTTQAAVRGLPVKARPFMDEWLRAHTPTRDRVFRTTRRALRQYKEEGLIPPDVQIPVREVDDRFIAMREPDERELYGRIETYISRFYDAWKEASGDRRRALGFVMTVYRRRLTSSFLAVERSLRRRLRALTGDGGTAQLIDEDDLAALEGSVGEDAASADGAVAALEDEIRELRSFLDELEARPPNESKMEYLLGEIDAAFRGAHDTVLVFTQYTDTMEYLREQLVKKYGSRVACYSGRGGERWDPEATRWLPAGKEDVKHLFREGRELKVLIGTDSLSEGLNLQTCGKLVNYDMPWNFMRVEQRIGRVDRIGGRPRVEISNYFYEDTVEEQVYRGIGEDVEWFEEVVGPAQPVLSEIESAIESVAVQRPSEKRQRALQQRVEEIRHRMAEAKDRPVRLEDLESSERPGALPDPAIDLSGLERVLTRSEATRRHLDRHPEIGGAYVLSVGAFEAVPVTMRRDVLDEQSPTVRLLTYGTTELDALLREALGPGYAGLVEGTEFEHDGEPVATLDRLEAILDW